MAEVTREELAEALREIVKVCLKNSIPLHCLYYRVAEAQQLLSRLDAETGGKE